MNKTTYKGIYNPEKNETEIIETRRDFYGQVYEKNIIGKYSGKPEKGKTTDPKNFIFLKGQTVINIYRR